MNLRYIERNGKLVLQQENWICMPSDSKMVPEWQDVPIIGEKVEAAKPREFWINAGEYHWYEVFESEESARASQQRSHTKTYRVTTIPKGYRVISRDDAFDAFDAMWTYHRNLNYDEKMKACLKELGFDE